ncbi:hypothetical protein GCM10027093_33130 [Paraburkholderia jirisanensis]
MMTLVTIGALLHDEHAAFVDVAAVTTSAREQTTGVIGPAQPSGRIYAVVSAFSGSEEAIVGVIRERSDDTRKLPG